MKFETYYQEYCNEVHKALGCYLYWRLISSRAHEDKALLRALNRTPLSWILTKHSLQVTLFMTLGRVFDIDGDSFSIDDLLKTCIDEIQYFSKEKLRERRQAEFDDQVEPEWMPDFIARADEIEQVDFKKLRSEVSKHRKIFEENYKPIRHKLFAHSDKDHLEDRDSLWSNTNIGELESILWFLYDLQQTLFDAYNNGKRPLLKGRKPNFNFYEDDFGRLLDQVKGA